MRRALAVPTLVVFLFGSAPDAEASPPKPLVRLFGLKAFALAIFSSAIQHRAQTQPRLVSDSHRHLASIWLRSVPYGVAKAVREDLKYYPSERPGFRPRLKHALVSSGWTPV